MALESKLQIYNRMLACLKELRPEFVKEASEKIQKRVLLMEEFRVGLRLGLYTSSGNEVKTNNLAEFAERQRKEVYFPAVDREKNNLIFFRAQGTSRLSPGPAGIAETSSTIKKIRDVNILDILIVPGLAFDLAGNRLGFGAGYYDQCLKEFRGKRLALAYDFQVYAELPRAVHGQKVDWIITESKIIKCQR